MKVHHLNCGTIEPYFSETSVCHVLLVETEDGLVLVDSGFGLQDIARPAERIGPIRHVIRPRLEQSETAAAQVRALGYDVADVTHIIATHLDLDHVGGVSDFPRARLHTTAVEAEVAYSGGIAARVRYNRAQLPAEPREIVGHSRGGETWWGFDGVLPLPEVADGIALVPLPGHTRGHTAVAVDAGDRWILHCGDAFYHRNVIEGDATVPASTRVFERLVAADYDKVRWNHARIRELAARDDPGLSIVCAHDAVLLERATQSV